MPIIRHSAQNGLDIRAPGQSKPNSFTVADNADMRFPGEVHKLEGYEEMSMSIVGGGTLTPYQVAYRGDELIAWGTDDRLYSWDAVQDGWIRRGSWTQLDVSLDAVAAIVGDQVNATGAAIGTWYLTAWEQNNASNVPEIAYEVRDTDDTVIASGTVETFSGGSLGDACPIVRSIATQWAILYHDSTSGSGLMRVRFVQLATPGTVSSATTLHTYTTSPTQNKHDMVARSADFIAATFDTIAATPTAVLWTFTSGGGATNTFATTAGSDHLPAIGYDLDSAPSFFTLYGLLSDEQTLEASRVQIPGLTLLNDNTLLLDGTDTFTSLVAVSRNEDEDLVLAGSEPTATLDYTRYIAVTTADVSSTPSLSAEDPIENAAVSHKPFVLRERVWAPILAQAEIVSGTGTAEIPQTSEAYLLYDVDRREVAARWAAGGVAATSFARAVWPPVDVSSVTIRTVASMSVSQPNQVPTIGATVFRDEGIYAVTISAAQAPRPVVEVQELVAMASGGFVRAWDGRDVFELDSHVLPVATVTPSGSSSVFAAGTYLWAIYWRWEDLRGQLHQSAPVIVSRTITNEDQVNFVVYGAPHTGKSRLQVGIARTAALGAATTGTFYDLLDFSTAFDATLGGAVTHSDSLTDAELILRGQYEQAGVNPIKPHEPTPAARFITEIDDRLWFGDPEYPSVVHFSLAGRSGFGPGLTPSDVVGTLSGPAINAVGGMDGGYFAFGENAIQSWQGDGPSPFFGDAGGYTVPLTLPATLGTTSQLLLARVPAGLFYVSPVGPRLLGREVASTDPFGAVGPLFMDGRMTPLTLLYLPGREEVVIYSPEAEVLPGELAAHPARTLRFSFGTARWSSEGGAQAESAAISRAGEQVFLRVDAQVCRHTPGLYLRGATRSQMALATNPLEQSAQQPMRLREIRVNGTFETAHSLQLCASYDDDDYFNDLKVVDTAQDGFRVALTDGNTPPAWMRVNLGFDKSARDATSPPGPPTAGQRYTYAFTTVASCYSVRVAINDLTADEPAVGSSFAYSGMLVTVEVIDPQQPAQLPAPLIV